MRFLVSKCIILSAIFTSFSANANEKKIEQINMPTTVTYQVVATRQIQQDEIKASFHIEKTDSKSQDLQLQINHEMKSALDIAKKFETVKTSTGRYFVYKDEKKSVWKGSQTILLDSFDQNSMAQLAGELQKNGFVVDNYAYTLSEKSKTSMDESMRFELLQKATQIAKNTIAKGLDLNFIRFAQIDFTSQNYYPVVSLRSFASSNSAPTNSPTAQAGLSDVQMSASVAAVFGK